MNRLLILFVLVFVTLALVGCGETVSGIGKDASRVTKGVRTIFLRDGSE